MSLKAEIETWAIALQLYDKQEFDQALAKFEDIADSSKILFNIGIIYATIGEHESAISNFRAATNLDQYLAVAYFQSGVSNFLLGIYDEAVKDFDDALVYLRGNLTIDYEQLGLKFRLYSCEVLFNKGLSLIYQGAHTEGMLDIQEARKEKQTVEHDVIDDAIQDRAQGYTVFSIPVGVLYRPASSKVKNLESKNYLGQAKLVAATDSSETFVGFTGSAREAARNASGLPTSTGPISDLNSRQNFNIQRRGTTNARLEGTATRSASNPNFLQNNLRRRPSDNTAISTTSRLQRSATTSTSSRSGNQRQLASMPENRELNNNNNNDDDYQSRRNPRSGLNQQNESYANVLENYQDTEPKQTLRKQSSDRVADWARQNSISGLSNSSGRGRLLSNRRPTLNTLNAPNNYEDGDGSGAEYPETIASSNYIPMTKIRVKLHHLSDVRGMAVIPETSLEDFVAKVTKKFSLTPGRVSLRYKDEEGSMVTILDDDDWETAVDTARAYAKGGPEGKVEIWVDDR
ncbi:hypothetical protein O181_085210 [Austropuccinia psidii MF-1]|uniref:PB1 domain-containing protein n=1 Tax=Austropuccinia psidii MF-1 TaxID=1389203 RepID=A0A9Q3FX40_9BASI|nr:hypothetical protein [Austropuccinia psidii MF-1]